MKYAMISSMDEKYYNYCGKTMLDSYIEYCSHIPMYLYNENFTPAHNVNLQGWNLGIEYEKFQSRHKKRTAIFGKKAFSIIHAMNNLDCDYLIWIDADAIFQKSLDDDVLDQVANDNTLSSHFSVFHEFEGNQYHSCETGFFVLNKKHKEFDNFKNTYTSIYVNDDNANLRRFYDGDVYGEVVNRLGNEYMYNLNISTKYKTPIKRSILKNYLEHYKGKGSKISLSQK